MQECSNRSSTSSHVDCHHRICDWLCFRRGYDVQLHRLRPCPAISVSLATLIENWHMLILPVNSIPILEVFHQATRSKGAATAFLLVITVCGFFALTGSIQTASRLTWSFARDDALVGSKWIGQIHPKLLVPVWALLANFAVVFVIGCVYLGSTTAFNAMIGTSLILMHLSFAFPIALLMFRRRSSAVLPSRRSFRLGAFGWVTNVLTLVMALLVLIFYNFPFVLPVTAGNMNYACVVLGVMAAFSVANWYGYARRRYQGPRIQYLGGGSPQ